MGEDLLVKKGWGSWEKAPVAEELEMCPGCLLESDCHHNQRRLRLGVAHPSQVYEKAVVSYCLVLTLLLAVVLGSAELLHQKQFQSLEQRLLSGTVVGYFSFLALGSEEKNLYPYLAPPASFLG